MIEKGTLPPSYIVLRFPFFHRHRQTDNHRVDFPGSMDGEQAQRCYSSVAWNKPQPNVPLRNNVTGVGPRLQPTSYYDLIFTSTRATWNNVSTHFWKQQKQRHGAAAAPNARATFKENHRKLRFWPALLHVSKGRGLTPSIGKSPHVIQGTHHEIVRAHVLQHFSPS